MTDGPFPFEVMLDTSVYVDVLEGRTSPTLDRLLAGLTHHSSVALSELTHLFGRLDPDHPETANALQRLADAIDAIPASRLSRPSLRAFGEAGMLAGLAARCTGRLHGVEVLNDACLLLHAAEKGHALLTANIADFDRLQQLAPQCRVVFYRRV